MFYFLFGHLFAYDIPSEVTPANAGQHGYLLPLCAFPLFEFKVVFLAPNFSGNMSFLNILLCLTNNNK